MKRSPTKENKNPARANIQRDALTPAERADKYYDLLHENLTLKKELHEQELNIKKAATRLQHLQVLVKKERELKFGKSEALLEQDLEKHLQELIDRNVELTDSNKKLSVIVKKMEKVGVQSKSQEKQSIEVKAKRAARGGGFRAATEETQKQIDEQEELIKKLKIQLSKTEKELQRVHIDREADRKIRERTGPFTANQDVDQLLFELHSKDLKIAELESRFEKISEAFKTKEALFDRSHQYYQNSITQLHEANIKITKLETQLNTASLAAAQVKDMQMQLDEMAHEKLATEARLNDLLEQPFIKNAGTESETYKRLQEVERLNMEKEYTIRSLGDKLALADQEINKLNDAVCKMEVQKEEAQKELVEMQNQLRKSGLEMEDVQRLLNFHDPSHFRDVMSSLKLDGKNPNWFMNQMEDQAIDLNEVTDPEVLKQYIERLRAEKMELATALEKAQTLLNVQTQMDKESGRLYEAEISELRMQLRANQQKVEELAHLADARQNKLVKVLKDGRGDQGTDPRVAAALGRSLVFDNQSEFSHDGNTTVIGEGENIIDLLLGKAEYDLLLIAECMKRVEGYELNLLGEQNQIDKSTGAPALPVIESMLTVDFYNHEPYTSLILPGPMPAFNFQISFRNEVEPMYVKILKEKAIQIDIYFLKGANTFKVAFGEIPLASLVKLARQGRKRGDQYLPSISDRKVPLFYHKSEPARPVQVGSLDFKLRLRFPMQEALRLFEEQEKMVEVAQKTAAQRELFESSKVKPTLLDKKAYKQRGVAITLKEFNLAQAEGLKPFLFYKFMDQEDYFSATFNSGRCALNETKRYYVLDDPSLQQYLQKEKLEIVFFDEKEPVQQIKPMLISSVQKLAPDVIGKAQIPLRELLNKNLISGNFDVTPAKRPQERIGVVTVEIHIFDPSAPDYTAAGGMAGHPPHLRIAEQEVLLRVALAIKSRNLDYESAFLLFDRNQDGLIDGSEFQDVVLEYLSLDIEIEMIQNFIESADLFKQRVTKSRFIAALDSIENRFSQRFTKHNLLERDQDTILNRSLGLSANNTMYRDLLDPLLRMMMNNGISHSQFRRVLLTYDRAGTGYVTKSSFSEIFTSLGIPMSGGDLEQLAQIMENKMTHKIQYLSMLQMMREFEKDDAHLSRIEQEGGPGGGGRKKLEESKISGSLLQSMPTLNYEEQRQRARVAEIKIADALNKKGMLLSRIMQGRSVNEKEEISVLGIDSFLKDTLGLQLRQAEVQAVYRDLLNLFGNEGDKVRFEVFLKLLGRLNCKSEIDGSGCDLKQID